METQSFRAIPALTIIQHVKSDWLSAPQWVRDAYESGLLILAPDHIIVRTDEGMQHAAAGQWLVKTGDGLLHVMTYRDMMKSRNASSG